MGGSSKFDGGGGGGLESIHGGAWGLKMTCEGVHLLLKFLPISLQA